MHIKNPLLLFLFLSLLSSCETLKLISSAGPTSKVLEVPSSSSKTSSIDLNLSNQYDRSGGLITADVNNNGRRDFIITQPGYIAAYDQTGNQFWFKQISIQLTGKAESEGLPGLHGPGAQVADVDGDGTLEVLFLTRDNRLHVIEGKAGKSRYVIQLEPPPVGASNWEHLVVANFRGRGDRDLLLQATNTEGYRLGRYIAAYSLDDLLKNEIAKPLWSRDDFFATAHSGVRVADLNSDGRDEVLGGNIIDPSGKIIFDGLPMQPGTQRPHLDSIFVADVRPDLPGLEVVALEEGGDGGILPGSNPVFRVGNRIYNLIFNRLASSGNRVFLYNHERLIWQAHYKHQEPQNAAIGDFDPSRPGLEIWCRSRYSEHQKPFVFDAKGQLIADYQLDHVAPDDWTSEGVEVIFTVDWTGQKKQLAAAKERHTSGDIAIFDPISGEFLFKFNEKADRLYVADVAGDWREELIVISGNQLKIYKNEAPNPNPKHPRLWDQSYYRRSKTTWNYYNP